MKKLSMLGAALAAATFATPVAAQVSPSDNGGVNTGAFQYGYDAGAGFVAFTSAQYQTSGCPIGGTNCYVGPSSFLGVYFAPSDGTYQGADLLASEVTFHPGNEGQQIGLQFVAATAGTYRFTGAFRAADAPNGNGVTYTTPEGTNLLGVRPATAPFNFTRTLGAGEAAQFTVGYNGADAFDTTGFRLSVAGVPEPATWALMIMGFGAVGGSLRARRRTSRVAFAA